MAYRLNGLLCVTAHQGTLSLRALQSVLGMLDRAPLRR